MSRVLVVPRSQALGVVVLLLLLELGSSRAALGALETVSTLLISSSSGWEIIAESRGDVEVKIDYAGIAARIEIPREFLKGRSENDTSFLSSDISNDYYYYSLLDEALHYSYTRDAPSYKPGFPPYDPNAPFMAEIWSHDGSGFIEFTPPKHVWMRSLTAPAVAGKYEFLVYIADKICDGTGAPLFPVTPTQTLYVFVSKQPFSASVSGFIIDPLTRDMPAIRTNGVVYALDKNGKPVARCFVDNSTGFFNVTGLSEGEYTLEASAGYCAESGFSYMPTRHLETIHVFRSSRLTLNMTLNRGCIIGGKIKYTKPDGTPISSLSHPGFLGLPQLWSSGTDQVRSLNYTVQALNDRGEVVASFSSQSAGLDQDPFILRDRAEMRHVGYPAVGTAYSGIPPGRYTLKAYVFGYVQRMPVALSVTSFSTENVEIRLVTGGLIAGTISFYDPRTLRPESPRMAERVNFGTGTGTMYGGNVVVSAYRSTGELAAVTLIQGATLNGTTAYADRSSIRFYMLGFSESLNRTFSGVWRTRDRGIPAGTYGIKVHVRGYRQQEVPTVTVSEGSNSSTYVRLMRQGGMGIVVASSAMVSGFSVEVPWAFKDLTPHPHLRVYVLRYGGSDVGYAETRIGPGVLLTRTPPLNFTGWNCTIPEIVFQGCLPSSVTDGTYVLRAFTFGYVQRSDVKVVVSAGIAVGVRIQVYAGLDLTGTVQLMAGNLFTSLTEDGEVRIEAHDSQGALAAAVLAYPKSGVGRFDFAMMGLRGEGHFFFVTSNGRRVRDYGVSAGTYTIKVQDFGVEWRYRVSPQSGLKIQVPGSTTCIVANRMGKVFGKVWGRTPENASVPLSWVAITAGDEMSFSTDGNYTLHLGEGSYQLVFSLPGYFSRSVNCTITGAKKVEYDATLDPI